MRLIEDFLARSNISRCSDFRETGEIVAKVGFKMFLNVTPAVVHHDGRSTASRTGGEGAPGAASSQSSTTGGAASSSSSANTNGSAATAAPAPGGQEFSLILDENPLSEFVELPPDAREGGLWWSNVLVGVLRGALEMVQLQTAPYFVSDVLRGDEQTELRVRLVKFLDEEAPPADD